MRPVRGRALRSGAGGPVAPDLTDDEVLRLVHHEHAGALYQFALRGLGDPAAAEDVVQETLVRAWRRAHQFDPARGDLRNWLFGITRHLIADRQRERRRVRDRIARAHQQSPIRVEEGPDRALESWLVSDALQRLSPEHRDVILETYFRGHTVREAARNLEVPPGTVKSRLHYGLRSLRITLEEMGVLQ